MDEKTITLSSLSGVREQILSKSPALFVASKTSTVIPFGDLVNSIPLVQLNLPSTIEYDQTSHELAISGNASWQEVVSFASSKGRSIRSYPTEELATPLAGVATSATGERSFGKGTLKNDLSKIEYLGFDGEIHELSSTKDLSEHDIFKSDKNRELLTKYRKSFEKYRDLKNGPIPRLEKEIDLMVGTEGQLGIITKINLATDKWSDSTHMFVKLNRWEESILQHEELIQKVNEHRECFIACEFLDSNSLNFIPEEDRPCSGKDLIILEIIKEKFDEVYDSVISKLTTVKESDVFEISSSKMHQIRMSIPRYVQEHNQKHGAFKSGTDAQVRAENFKELMNHYQSFSKEGIPYLLFGHIGDHHLHFNFLNNSSEQNRCDELFKKLYSDCIKWNASPFAEHGIGILKQKYIYQFLEPIHLEMFNHLKKMLDPFNQFFPTGYMNIKESK